MKAWNIYLNNRKIDTVFYQASCDKHDVYDGLVNHDGKDCRIVVRVARIINC
jgi:hypothetical protein